MIFGAENMAIVLREAAHTHDAVQTARRLVAVALPEFAVTQRQITVALDALLEDQDVPRTVHRLQGVFTLFRLGREHVVTVLVPVTGFFPQAFVDDLWAFDFVVTAVAVDLAHVLLHLLPDGPPFGMPENQTGRVVVDMEQVQLTAELAVIAFFGLFKAQQILLQVFFAGPSGAIHALKHFVFTVATPVGPRDLHQFEVLKLAGAGHVGTAAQIFEVAFTVQTDGLIGRNGGDDFGFVMLTQAFEISHGLVTGQHAAHDGLVFGHQFAHAFFDGDQIVRRERTAVREVVIKTVVDHWTDGDLRFREQLLDGVGQQVGRRMADQLQTLRILGRHDGQLGTGVDAKAGVDQSAIDLAAQSRFGQACTNRSGHVGHRHGTGKLTQGTVGKSDLYHGIQK